MSSATVAEPSSAFNCFLLSIVQLGTTLHESLKQAGIAEQGNSRALLGLDDLVKRLRDLGDVACRPIGTHRLGDLSTAADASEIVPPAVFRRAEALLDTLAAKIESELKQLAWERINQIDRTSLPALRGRRRLEQLTDLDVVRMLPMAAYAKTAIAIADSITAQVKIAKTLLEAELVRTVIEQIANP
ncbi:MAG: hypothetical protein K2W82_15935 [Candidatus Obscuribacterales bacterium]|nr:hypothetical protein [Candidatus Obscuribacterales bacterium]